MRSHDVLIVGGGPGGLFGRARLKAGGADVLVLDKETFPRLKLCAGWITPEVVRDLEMDPKTYPHRFLTFDKLHIHVKGLHLKVPCVQHSIRRFEFDAWLLERSGAPVVQHTVKHIRHENGEYVIDDAFRVQISDRRRRHALSGVSRASSASAIRAPMSCRRRLWSMRSNTTGRIRDCHLWFFEKGLPGYAWYVPKQNGWLNVGLGGMADAPQEARRQGSQTPLGAVHRHARTHARARRAVSPRRLQLLPARKRGSSRASRTPSSPAMPRVLPRATCAKASARRSAAAFARRIRFSKGTTYQLDDVTGASLGGGLASRMLDWAFTRGAARPA